MEEKNCLISMSEHEYRVHNAVNQSAIKDFLTSPTLWKYRMEHRSEATAAMSFGTAFHTLILEEELFERDYLSFSGSKNSKVYKNMVIDNPDKTILSEADMNHLFGMKKSLMQNPAARNIFESVYAVEQSVLWQDDFSQTDCKGRLDIITSDNWIVDLKTTQDASPKGFKSSCGNYRMDIQAAFYMDGYAQTGTCPKGFIFVCVEKKPPYLVGCHELSPALLSEAQMDYQTALIEMQEVLQTPEDLVAGYGSHIHKHEMIWKGQPTWQ